MGNTWGSYNNIRKVISSYMAWGYQDFTAGTIAGTSATLTANQNGNSITFDVTKVVNSSAIIVRKADLNSFAYSGVFKLFSTKVAVTGHTGAAVTLNAIPNASWGDLRVYYYYTYSVIPVNFSMAPKFVSSQMFDEVDALFLTSEELGGMDGIIEGDGLGNISALTKGIAQNNIPPVSAADVGVGEYSRFTATGLEGRSASELLGDLGNNITHRIKMNLINNFLNY